MAAKGVSGVKLRITKSGKLLGATVAGKPVVDDKLYTVATIDYLADGNSDMTALIQPKREIVRRVRPCAVCLWTM